MAIEHTPLQALITAHWDSLQRQSLPIPELSTKAEPVVIYFDPLSLAERDALAPFTGGEAVAELIIRKALDENGKKLFTPADKPLLLNRSGGWTKHLADRINAADIIPPDLLGK